MHAAVARALPALALVGGGDRPAPTANADNQRLNDSVVANVYTIQQQAGCNDRRSRSTRSCGWPRSGTPTTCSTTARSTAISAPTARRSQDRANAAGFDGVGRRDRRDQPGAGDQRRRDHEPVVLPARLHGDHVELRQHRTCGGVVGRTALRPHRRRRGLRPVPAGRLLRSPSRPSCLGSRCQFLAILTRRSRYTLVPSSFSICMRAAVPTSRSRAPPLPMTMPFWLSRST